MAFRKILLPTDLSSEGERAFQTMAKVAPTTGATIVLLHVIENPGAPPTGERFPAPSVLPGTKEEIARTRALLEKRRGMFAGGVEVVMEVLVAPSVPHAIADYAQKSGCDLIAVSTHGRGGFRRLIMGSVAEAVLRLARVPVLVFPRQE